MRSWRLEQRVDSQRRSHRTRGPLFFAVGLTLMSFFAAGAQQPVPPEAIAAPSVAESSSAQKTEASSRRSSKLRISLELLSGMVAEVALAVPLGLMGREGGDDAERLICPNDCRYPYTAQKVGVIGALSGGLVGAGLGVSLSGSLLGGEGLAPVSIAGAMTGSTLGSGLMFVLGDPDDDHLLLLLPSVGALVGAVLAYELSDSLVLSSPEQGLRWGTVPRIGTELLVGAAGAAVLMVPLMFQGGQLGRKISITCEDVCFGHNRREEGAFIGAALGIAVGAGLGVTWAGSSLGGNGHWLAALGGAAAGTAVGVGLKQANKQNNALMALPPAGALVGAIVGYELSNRGPAAPQDSTREPTARVSPSLMPMQGGGMVGAVGQF